MKLNTSLERRAKRARELWRDRSASEASPCSFKDFAALSSCTLFMPGAAVKLTKLKARFPFFVRQVSKKRLECVHVCKVLYPKGPQNGPKMTPVYKLILSKFVHCLHVVWKSPEVPPLRN